MPPTETPAPTETPEPTPTEISAPKVLFEDDFETGAGEWFIGESPEGSNSVGDGQLIIEVKNTLWHWFASHPDLERLDANILEVDLAYISGATDSSAGIRFRCSPGGAAWVGVYLGADGFFSVARADNVDDKFEFTDVIPWALNPAIKLAPAVNHVRLIDDSEEVTVIINGEQVANFPYADLEPGCPFLFATTFEQGGAVWTFDNVSVHEIVP